MQINENHWESSELKKSHWKWKGADENYRKPELRIDEQASKKLEISKKTIESVGTSMEKQHKIHEKMEIMENWQEVIENHQKTVQNQ